MTRDGEEPRSLRAKPQRGTRGDLQAVLEQLDDEGTAVPEDAVEQLSPLAHHHINFHGRYQFRVDEAPGLGPPRPLRDPTDPRGPDLGAPS